MQRPRVAQTAKFSGHPDVEHRMLLQHRRTGQEMEKKPGIAEELAAVGWQVQFSAKNDHHPTNQDVIMTGKPQKLNCLRKFLPRRPESLFESRQNQIQ